MARRKPGKAWPPNPFKPGNQVGAAGRFKKGNPGGPGGKCYGLGRPREDTVALERAFLMAHQEDAQAIIVAYGLKNPDYLVRVETAKWCLERLNGRARQAIEAAVSTDVRIIVEDARGRAEQVPSLREFYARYPAALPPPDPVVVTSEPAQSRNGRATGGQNGVGDRGGRGHVP